MKFCEYIKSLNESYINLFDSDKDKEKYLDEVWDLLQKSYASKGGFHSVKNKEDLLSEVKMWKLSKKGGKLVAGILYKDRNGRKSVGIFSDGSTIGKHELFKMYTEDLIHKRAFKEVSKSILDWLEKYNFPVKDYLVTAKDAKEIINDNTFEFTDDEFAYSRMIKGTRYTKYLLGDVDKVKNKEYSFDL